MKSPKIRCLWVFCHFLWSLKIEHISCQQSLSCFLCYHCGNTALIQNIKLITWGLLSVLFTSVIKRSTPSYIMFIRFCNEHWNYHLNLNTPNHPSDIQRRQIIFLRLIANRTKMCSFQTKVFHTEQKRRNKKKFPLIKKLSALRRLNRR